MALYNEENASPTVENSFAEQLEHGIAKGIEQGIEQGIEKGIEQGIEQGSTLEKKSIAKKLLDEKLSLETITNVTGLTLEEVQALAKE